METRQKRCCSFRRSEPLWRFFDMTTWKFTQFCPMEYTLVHFPRRFMIFLKRLNTSTWVHNPVAILLGCFNDDAFVCKLCRNSKEQLDGSRSTLYCLRRKGSHLLAVALHVWFRRLNVKKGWQPAVTLLCAKIKRYMFNGVRDARARE